ncbi:MAG: LysR family transcriptional regulator [Pigmentiphaga sp.]|nr:LysR family transcriptional regulator [Pigmentiphaga sp.]
MHNDIDLNLLQFFNTLYIMRSVTLTAEHLGITQPAASQRLVRLRNLLHDPLFTRVSGGMKPTPVADQLAPFVSQAMDLIQRGLAEHQTFDPRQSKRRYRFHMSDMAEARFLPQLLEALPSLAPGIRLECSSYDLGQVADLLHEGHLDFALGSLPMLEGLEQQPLIQDIYVLVSRRSGEEEEAETPVNRDDMQDLEYISVRSNAPPHAMLLELGLENRIRQNASNTLVMLKLIQQFGFHGILASSVAYSLLDMSKFSLRPFGFPQTPFTVSLYWSQRYAHLEYHRWMKNHIASSVC